MKNWQVTPQNLCVSQFIQCYWYLEKHSHDVSHQYPKLNPDPAATLLITPSDQPYHYQNGSIEYKGVGSHWLFPNSQTLQLDHSKPFKLLGIKFHVGALYSLNLSIDQPRIDEVIEYDFKEILNKAQISELQSKFSKAESVAEIRDFLDNALVKVCKGQEFDKHAQLAQSTLQIIDRTPISELGKQLGCSQRTLERSFSRVTGFTLKQCQSMNKFELLLARLYKQKREDVNWLDIVNEFDFSDQPHLIKYLKNLIGDTPTAYLSKRDLTIDTYGDFTVHDDK